MVKVINELKKYKCFILMCLLIISGGITCFASSIDVTNCDVNAYDGYVTIEGTVSDAAIGQVVTLKVLNPEKELTDLVADLPSVVFNYVNQAIIKADGSFRFYYKMTGAPSYYTVILNTDNLVAPWTKQMSYVESSQVDAAIAKLNGVDCDTKDELYAYLSLPNTQFILAMDMTFFDKISSLEAVCGLLTLSPRTAYISDADFRTRLKNMSIVQAINEAQIGATVENLIQTYNVELGLNALPRYSAFTANTAVKDSVCISMMNKSFTKLEKVQTYFEEQVVLKKLWKMVSYGEVPAWITDNNDLMKLSLTKYNQLDDKTAVQKAIVGKNFNDLAALARAFNTAVDAQYKKENPVSGGGSPGSGSGSKTTSVTVGSVNTVAPEIPNSNTEKYNDLENVVWAKESIGILTNLGVLSGDGTGNFYPEKSVTREEFVKMIVTTFGLVNHAAITDCKDVKAGEWYYEYIASAIEKGIVQGYENGTFGIGEQITRQDMAVILSRVAKSLKKDLPAKRTAVSFTDNYKIASYASDAVVALYNSGIVNGFEDGGFAPTQSSTRAEAAKMVYELYRLLQ